MKKIVFCFIVLLLPLILVAQSITINYNGIRGSDGPFDYTAVYGETVSVRINYSPSGMSTIDGIYYGSVSPVDDKVLVHYYSISNPTSTTHLGSVVTDITNFTVHTVPDTACTFEFVLQTYSGNTAYSFQIECGLRGTDTGSNTIHGVLKTSYIKVGNTSSAGSIMTWLDYLNNNGNPLPVSLSSFTASFVDDTPTLFWTTQSETNNNGWNVYRSISQNNGQAMLLNVDLVPGYGTTPEPTNYQFDDNHGVLENTTYWYWVESVDYSGETELFGPISLLIPLGGGNSGAPATQDDYGLHQNFPNPFNPSTEIKFALDESSHASLTIFNTKGEKVKTIFENKSFPEDEVQSVVWDGKDESGRNVASGIYLYQLRTKHDVYMKKMVLTK